MIGAVPIEDALALHLGRVRGQHRLDARALEERDELLVGHVRGAQPLERLTAMVPSAGCDAGARADPRRRWPGDGSS